MSFPPATGAVELESFHRHTVLQLSHGKRLDHRPFDAIRVPSVVPDVSPPRGALAAVLCTDGGGAFVSCAVRGAFGPPPPDSPGSGRLTLHVSAPFLRPPPPPATCRALARFVRGVLLAGLDLRALAAREGAACWVLHVALVVRHADGNVRAVALHAAAAALCGLALPRARLPDGEAVESRVLRFRAVPVAVTVGVVGRALLVDTSAAEEAVADHLVTVAVDADGGILAIAQSGARAMQTDMLARIVRVVQERAGTIRAAICNKEFHLRE